jgi:hypothetical protein
MSNSEAEILSDILKIHNKILLDLESLLKELRELKSIIKSGQNVSIQRVLLYSFS